jgi:hypothetical protein
MSQQMNYYEMLKYRKMSKPEQREYLDNRKLAREATFENAKSKAKQAKKAGKAEKQKERIEKAEIVRLGLKNNKYVKEHGLEAYKKHLVDVERENREKIQKRVAEETDYVELLIREYTFETQVIIYMNGSLHTGDAKDRMRVQIINAYNNRPELRAKEAQERFAQERVRERVAERVELERYREHLEQEAEQEAQERFAQGRIERERIVERYRIAQAVHPRRSIIAGEKEKSASELQDEEFNEESEAKTCKACLHMAPQYVAIPCGHFNFCHECKKNAPASMVCPTCREKMTYLRIYH